MEDKIYDILTDLVSHDITKNEALEVAENLEEIIFELKNFASSSKRES